MTAIIDANERWSRTLKHFIETTGSLPPVECYEVHPATESLAEALIARKAASPANYPEREAAAILRNFIRLPNGLFWCEGLPQEHLESVTEMVEFYRVLPQARGYVWRETQRLKILLADLLQDKVPKCDVTREAWEAIRAAHIPNQIDFTSNFAWVN